MLFQWKNPFLILFVSTCECLSVPTFKKWDFFFSTEAVVSVVIGCASWDCHEWQQKSNLVVYSEFCLWTLLFTIISTCKWVVLKDVLGPAGLGLVLCVFLTCGQFVCFVVWFCFLGVFYFVCFELVVQVIAQKDLALNWSFMCRVRRRALTVTVTSRSMFLCTSVCTGQHHRTLPMSSSPQPISRPRDTFVPLPHCHCLSVIHGCPLLAIGLSLLLAAHTWNSLPQHVTSVPSVCFPSSPQGFSLQAFLSTTSSATFEVPAQWQLSFLDT